MNYIKFEEELEKLVREEEYEEVVERVRGLGEHYRKNLTPYSKYFFALSIVVSKYPDFIQVYRVLEDIKDDFEDKEKWHECMGIAYSNVNRFYTAKKHMELALKYSKGKETKNKYEKVIEDIRKNINLGLCGSPFNYRANMFWNNFIQIEEDLIRMLDTDEQQDFNSFLDFFESMLLSYGIEIKIEVYPNVNGRAHIVLLTEGKKSKLILIKQFIKLMPSQLQDEYIFSIGKPVGLYSVLKVDDIILTYENVEAAYFINRKKVDIYLKNEQLQKLNEIDFKKAKSIAKTFATNFFGEIFCMKNVSDVFVAIDEPLRYKSLHIIISELDKIFADVKMDNYPYNDYNYYNFDNDMFYDTYIRNSNANTLTCVEELLYDYVQDKTTTFDESFDLGIVYITFILDVAKFNCREQSKIKFILEQHFVENKDDDYEIIGLSEGEFYILIDLALFDNSVMMQENLEKHFIPKFRELGIETTYVSVYRAGELELSLYNDRENFKKRDRFRYSEQDREIIEKFIKSDIGEIEDILYDTSKDEVVVDLFIVKPNEERNFYTLITCGLGARPMKIPDELKQYDLARCELMVCLPADWDVYSEEEKYLWPKLWLKLLSDMVVIQDTYLYSSSFVSGEDFFPKNVDYKGMLVVTPAYIKNKNHTKLSSKEDINFYQIIPLYEDEADFMAKNDDLKLFDEMEKQISFDDVFIINEKRKNVCK